MGDFLRGVSNLPVFKSRKRTIPSFYHDNLKIKFTDRYVRLSRVGMIKLYEYTRMPINTKYYNPRVIYNGLNWYITVGIDVQDMPLSSKVSEPIGIDLGIKNLAIISNGKVYKNINKSVAVSKANKRLKQLQRRISRQYLKIKKLKTRERSKNLLKLEKRINKTYKRLTDIRTNYIHQITTKLVKTNPEYVVIEDLDIKGMMKNKHLSKAVADQKLYEFRRQLVYKCLGHGVRLVIADRWYPSSKTCSCCGNIKKDLKLSDRVYKCECGLEMDRDLNASINLREYPKLANII